jgi:hypothetical protein
MEVVSNGTSNGAFSSSTAITKDTHKETVIINSLDFTHELVNGENGVSHSTITNTTTTRIPSKIPIVAAPSAPDLFHWPRQNDRGYTIKEEPLGTKSPFKIIVMGAGASGISFCKTAAEKLENVEVVCYEKNDEVGGTWYENRLVILSRGKCRQ